MGMMRGLVLGGLCLAAVAGCKKGGEMADPEETKTGTDTTRGSAGGFSAGLGADLARTGSGSAPESAPALADASAESAGSAVDAGAGAAGSAGSGSASAGSGSAGSASGAGSAVAAKVPEVKPDAGAGSAPPPPKPAEVPVAVAPAVTPPPRPVEMTAEMKAIKLSLLPNWVRDVVGPGTISLEVSIQSRSAKGTFRFDYGYESDKAPTDRELYKKYLADTKQMTVTTDRQRGAAWYLEGPDGTGKMSFKLVVLYGGKRLICGGSAYKDSDFGDVRDEVVVQAKKICESIAL